MRSPKAGNFLKRLKAVERAIEPGRRSGRVAELARPDFLKADQRCYFFSSAGYFTPNCSRYVSYLDAS
jgi:hypothetical protein